MKWRGIFSLGVVALLCSATPAPRDAAACGGSYEILTHNASHPDLPLARFAAGKLGILQRTYARSYLVVAYRWLTPVGMTSAEQEAVVALWKRRHSFSSIPQGPLTRWIRERDAAMGTRSTRLTTSLTTGHAWAENCLPDAFRAAGARLAERVQAYGRESATLVRFVEGQDAAFSNCGGGPVNMPPALPDGTALEHADRAYHQASAHFYALNHDEAVRRFEAIAADASSPYRTLARYLVARTKGRKASLTADDAEAWRVWGETLAELQTILGDASAAEVHGAARELQDRARAHAEPLPQARRLAVELATLQLGSDLGRKLGDYTTLIDRVGIPKGEDDRLSTWLRIVQSRERKHFEQALGLYLKTKAPVWMVAALMTAPPDADVGPLLAADVDPSHPAFATVRFHRARLLAAYGEPAKAYALLDDTTRALGTSVTPSMTALMNAASFASATTIDQTLKHVAAKPAAERSDSAVGTPVDYPATIHPQAAESLSAVPTGALVELVERDALLRPIQAALAATVWVRAQLVDRPDLARRISDRVAASNPKIADFIVQADGASSRDQRRLAVLHMMLSAPQARPLLRPFDGAPLEPATLGYSDGGSWWCGPSRATAPVWTSQAQRRRGREELALFEMPGPNFLAAEAVRLARVLPDDPRIPEVLHLSVVATRYGCRDGETTQHSRTAFRYLHAHYPKSAFTAKTRYHY